MFWAFSWFEKPAMLAAARRPVLDWAASGELLVYLEVWQAALTKRYLSQEELNFLKTRIGEAWDNQAFGGYIASTTSGAVSGWVHFKLDPDKQQAQLVGLLLSPELAELPPLQSPVLHLAILALLEQLPGLQRIYLPFLEISEEARSMLAICDLVEVEKAAGWWLVDDKQRRKIDLLAFGSARLYPNWLELSLPLEVGLADYVTRIFEHYGFRQGTLTEWPTVLGPQGENLLDETGPVIVSTHIPVNEMTEATIARLQVVLASLNKLTPLSELEISRLTAEEWANLWQQDNQLYRLGQHFVILIESEEATAKDYNFKPDDLVIKISSVEGVFSPDNTGIHPTTRAVLQLLEQTLKPGEHHKLLDLGTGSGVLAMAAIRLGVASVLALDANRLAVEAARLNVAQNDLSDKIQVEAGSLAVVAEREGAYSFPKELQEPPPVLAEWLPFDVILANTFAPVLIELAAPLTAALRPGGLLISSGIGGKKAEEVEAALKAAGLIAVGKQEQAHWLALVHQKPL